MSETKRIFHYYLPTEYEREEAFLREQHAGGFRLVYSSFGFYTFAPCEPEDYLYRLVFRPLRGENWEAYEQPFREHGWEYVQASGQYCYFRKRADELEEGDLDVFGDETARMAALQRMFRVRMIGVAVVILFMLVPQLRDIRDNGLPSAGILAVCAVWYALVAVYAVYVARMGAAVYRIQKKHLLEQRTKQM